MSAPIIVMKQSQQRENGKKVRLDNISAAKAVADIVRTCLGPNAMLKMLLDPMGGIVITNDGNAILRDIQVQNPAAKSIIEISRSQDEEVGDGTTSVVILAGELMSFAEPLVHQSVHPIHIINGFRAALEDALEYTKKLSIPINMDDQSKINKVIECCLGTKINSEWSELVCSLAWKAIKIVENTRNGRLEIDFKRYARIEKISGGDITDCCVIPGIVLNKDVVHTDMRRYIKNPRILLLDCSLEYKKGESQTSIELMKAEDFNQVIQLEEESIKRMCQEIIAVKPDLVFTEKGCSDLAQHFLHKAGITVLRRLKKTDNNRLARAVGATIVNRTEDITPKVVGTGAGLFEVRKIGDEYYSYILDCKDPKACTILLRGASKDVLNEIERNLNDALNVARNLVFDPTVVPGGGAFEIALSIELENRSKKISSRIQWPYQVAAHALDVIPRTLIQNCGKNQLKLINALKEKQISENNTRYGLNGNTGEIEDMVESNIVDNTSVKTQVLKVAFEVCMMLLKIDDIVSGSKKASDADSKSKKSVKMQPTEESMQNAN